MMGRFLMKYYAVIKSPERVWTQNAVRGLHDFLCVPVSRKGTWNYSLSFLKTLSVQFSSVQLLKNVWLFATPWIAAPQASLSITNSRQVHSNSCPSRRWCNPTISSSVVPSPALSLSQHQGLFKWVSSPHQVAIVLEFQLQHQSFQWTPRTDLL